MKSGSLSRRTVIATLGVLVLAMGGFATVITLRYRDGLRGRARTQLLAGARAFQIIPVEQVKPLIASLALEGINADVRVPHLGNAAPAGAASKAGPGAASTAGVGAASKPGAPRTTPLKPGTPSATGGHLLTITEPVSIGGATGTATLSTSEAYIDSSVNRLIVIELLAGAAVLVAASILTLLASRSALRPLRHVSAVAQRIASGERRQRLHPRRRDTELGRMAASFDAMVDSLEEAVAQATRSEAAMRRFLADASHELRTPIAALQATTETLLREQPPRPRRDQLEAQLARGAQRLGRLVDDLLNLARLESNEPLRTEVVDLAQVGESLVADARRRASGQISLTHEGPAMVNGDPDALARAMRNLLDNAITAGGDAGTVTLDVRGLPTSVQVTVSDDGPGVPPEARERIFEGFVRLNGSSRDGTGLGLAIARAIAQQHHGRVTCVDCDAGARFLLELPAAQPGQTEAMVSSSRSSAS